MADITVRFTLTRQDVEECLTQCRTFRAGFWDRFTLRCGGLMASAALAWLLLFPPSDPEARHALSLFAFMGAAMAATAFYGLFIRPKRDAASVAPSAMDQELTWRFTEEGMVRESSATQSGFAWNYWCAFGETDDYFMLHQWPQGDQLIPKRALEGPEQWTSLRELFLRKLPRRE